MKSYYIFSRGEIVDGFSKDDVISFLKKRWGVDDKTIKSIFEEETKIKNNLTEYDANRIVELYKGIGLIVICKKNLNIKELITYNIKRIAKFIFNIFVLWHYIPAFLIEKYWNFFKDVFYMSNYWVLQGPILVALLLIFIIMILILFTVFIKLPLVLLFGK